MKEMNEQQWSHYLKTNPVVKWLCTGGLTQTVRIWGPLRYIEAENQRLQNEKVILERKLVKINRRLKDLETAGRSLRSVR